MAAATYQIGTTKQKDTLKGKEYTAKFFVITSEVGTYTKEIGNELSGVGTSVFPSGTHCVACIPGAAGQEGQIITLVGREANFNE